MYWALKTTEGFRQALAETFQHFAIKIHLLGRINGNDKEENK
jgi:hypothetical protein